MHTDRFKRRIITLGLVILSIILSYAEAFPWGFATHAYIDNHLGRQHGIKNADEIYGGQVPDIFVYSFELPFWQDIYNDTHFDFMKLANTATNDLEKSLAFGFASHNNLWGADMSAHTLCFTCGEPDGYAIAKAGQVLTEAPLPPELGIPYDVAIEILHELAENGVDLLVKRTDPLIGQKISTSAMLRSPQFPAQIAGAYAGDLSTFSGLSYAEAQAFITEAEGEFRKNMILYGQILTLDEETALMMISQQTAGRAKAFLARYGIELPVGDEELVELVKGYTRLAMYTCEPDYLLEIETTIRNVDDQMAAHGFTY